MTDASGATSPESKRKNKPKGQIHDSRPGVGERFRAPSLRREIPHVVVIGGGFAGVGVVRALRNTPVRVTLIDQNVYKTFQPLLYQVATAGLNPGDVTMFLRGLRLLQRNMRYRQGELDSIDRENKFIKLADGGRMDYDHLVLASGATTNYFGTPGAEEYAMPMYTRSQALAIRDRIFTHLERASREHYYDHQIEVVIVGGGATGVEIAGALADFRIQELSIVYPELADGTMNVTILQRGDTVLKPFNEKLQKYAIKELEDRQVKLCFGSDVVEVTPHNVKLKDGREIPAHITIWAAGVTISETVKDWDLEQGRGGRIKVDAKYRALDAPDVYAAGDIAVGPDALPQLAAPAIQTGRYVAKVIDAEVNGKDLPEDFEYFDKGTMATIGRHAAIAQLPHGLNFTGSLGWLAWIAVHVATLIGHRNRRATLINLGSLYLGSKGTHQPNPIMGEIKATAMRRPGRQEKKR